MSDDVESLAPGLWVLGNGHIHVYLARGTAATAVIEVGVSATAGPVIRQLDALGARPDYLVVTHPHADHLSGLGGLRAHYPAASVVASAGAAAFAAHPKAARGLVEEDRHMAAWLETRGFPGDRPPVGDTPPLEGACTARDGDALDLGGLTLRFLKTEGHSPGSLAVHLPEIAALLPSDALGFHYPGRGFCPLFFTGFPDYLRTLDRLGALEPRLLGLGHHGVFRAEAVPRAFRDAREAAVNLAREVRDHRGDREALAEAIFRRVYVDEMTLYSPANIRSCVQILLRRSLESGRPGEEDTRTGA